LLTLHVEIQVNRRFSYGSKEKSSSKKISNKEKIIK
jgi:hypothetical protein